MGNEGGSLEVHLKDGALSPCEAGQLASRKALVARILSDSTRAIVSISAPFGYGKTGVLDEVSCEIARTRSSGAPLAFPVPLVRHLAAAHAGDDEIEAFLQAMQADSRAVAMVIDDVDRVGSSQRRRLVDGLASWQQAGRGARAVRHAIVSSSSVVDEIEALRLEQGAVVVRLEELSLPEDEVVDALMDGGAMDEGDARAICRFVEGWPFGARALRGHPEVVRQGVVDTCGSLLADIFSTRVCQDLSADDLLFLEHASLLWELTPDACDHSLGVTGSALALERISKRMLFLGKREGKGPYRLSAPLRDFLLTRLFETEERQVIEAIAARAAEWLEQHGRAWEAAALRVLTCDENLLKSLMLASTDLPAGFGMPFAQWVCRQSPADGEPRLDFPLLFAWVYVCCGRARDARAWARLAQVAGARHGASPGRWAGLSAACLHAKCLSLEGDYDAAIREARAAQAQAVGAPVPLACMIEHTLGESYAALCQYVDAKEHYIKADAFAELERFPWVLTFCRYDLASVRFLQGHLVEAGRLCEGALESAPENTLVTSAIMALRARVLMARGSVSAAREVLSAVPTVPQGGQNENFRVDVENAYAHLALLEGLSDRAYRIAFLNAHIAQQRADAPRDSVVSASALRAKIACKLGMLDDAVEQVAVIEERWRPDDRVATVVLRLLCARIAIGRGAYGEAVDGLNVAIDEASETGLLAYRLEALVLQAVCWDGMGNAARMSMALNLALELGANRHIVDAFVFEAPKMTDLVCSMVSSRRTTRPARRFAKELLELLPGCPNRHPGEGGAQLKRDRLTLREREVLDLLNLGMTRREIAEELGITLNTVKVHITNIYAKLGVDNRLDAFHEAREPEEV